jgi:Cd2+/Zn2+-exporting ATPase
VSRPKKQLPVIQPSPVAAPEREVAAPPTVGSERTVVRVEGMDCASCAVTVEKRVSRLPGVHRAVVNFAAGRLDAEHSPAVKVEEIERAVRDAGYEVGSIQEVEKTSFWRTPRALLTLASALLFALGFVRGSWAQPR